MTDEDKAREAAAIEELDRLTAAHLADKERAAKSRDALQEAIVKHLKARTLRPSTVEEHTPYDRVHIGRIRRAAGVPPLRQPTVRGVKDSDGGPE